MPAIYMEGEDIDGKHYSGFTYKVPGKPDRYFTERLLPEMKEKADAGDAEAMFYVALL